MRKLKIALTLLFAMSFSLFLFACGGAKAVQRIQLEGAKTTFTESDDFSAEGLTVKVQFKGEKEYETFKAEKGTVDAEKKIIKYADFEVDYSAFVKGEAGEYDIVVTPDPEGQKKADEKLTTLVSETYKVTVEHAYGAAVDGVETCTVCQAEREVLTLDETITTEGWGTPAKIQAASGTAHGVKVSNGNEISYGLLGIGQSARITMTVTTDDSAVWNTPLMGIRNGDNGILPREDNWIIRAGEGWTTNGNGTGSGAASGSKTEALAANDWDIFFTGSTWIASDYNKVQDGATVEYFYNYSTDGVMEIRKTLNPGANETVQTYFVKVPAAAYEIMCYGEKAVMHVTKVEYVRNLLLLDYTMSSGPDKKVYAENTYFDVKGIATTASYTRNISSPITTYNVYADIDVEETTGEGAEATTKTVTKQINLLTNKLIAGMKNFRLEFGGKTIELKDANAITVKPSAIDRVYAGEFLYGDVLFAAENATYTYDVNSDGDVSVLVSGKADRLTAAQKAKLGTEEDYYIAFRIMATKSNALGNLAAQFDDGTLAGATVIPDTADGALNIILPVNANTASAVINLKKGGENLANTIKLDVTGLEKVAATTIASTVDAGEIYIDNGGSVQVTYYNIPTDTSKLSFTVGSRSATYEKVSAATAAAPVTVGSAKVTGFVKEGNNVTVTYTFVAPALNNTFTPEFVVALTNDGNVVTTNTLRYTFAMSTSDPAGYVKVADNVYLKSDGTYLLVIAFLNGDDLQARDLLTNVSVNIQNELAQAYDLSVVYNAGNFVIANTNDVTLAKGTDIKATINGTVGNADDFDYGAVVVLRADLTALGIRAEDAEEVYYFEVPGQNVNQAGDYSFYKVAGDELTTITIAAANVPEETELQALQCLQDGYFGHAYKADGSEEVDFYYGGRYVKASGAHTWVADEGSTTSWTCSVCGSTKVKITEGGVSYDVVTSPKSAAKVIINNDTTTDGWWVAAEASSTINLVGDFNVTYYWTNIDAGYAGDGGIEMFNSKDEYFAMRTFVCDYNPGPGSSKLCGEGSEDTHVFTKNGETINAIDGAASWEGDVAVTVRRLGTTLTFHQTLTTKSGDVYVAISTITNFTTDNLTCRVAGNPYWCSDISVAIGNVGSSKSVDLKFGAEDNSTGYTGDEPLWTSVIKSGQKVVVSGDMKAANNVWNAALPYIYPVGTEVGLLNFRPDNWINGVDAVPDQGAGVGVNSAYKFSIQKFTWSVFDPDWFANINAIKANCKATITWDWSSADRIIVSANFVNGERDLTAQYTITSTAAFEDYYEIALGVDGAYLHATKVEVII